MAESSHAANAGTLVLPSKLFRKKFGFGIDFGSSTIKLVYTTVDGDNLIVNFVNFPRQYHTESFEYLHKVCKEHLEAETTYHTTGIGIGENQEEFDRILNVKSVIDFEDSCMLDAFKFLAKHQSWSEFVYPTDQEEVKKGTENAKSLVDVMNNALDVSVFKKWPFLEKENDKIIGNEGVRFPAVLSLVGSGHYIYMVEEAQGESKILDFYTIAGRTFLGLGTLLTDAEGYREITQSAAQGDAAKVDQLMSNTGVTSEDEVYNSLESCQQKLFAFGCATKDKSKERPKKDDINAALVSLIANSVAQDAFNWSLSENINQVFFLGGIPSNDALFRKEIQKEFTSKSYCNIKNHAAECFFLKSGGHLPAIGSLLNNLQLA